MAGMDLPAIWDDNYLKLKLVPFAFDSVRSASFRLRVRRIQMESLSFVPRGVVVHLLLLVVSASK